MPGIYIFPVGFGAWSAFAAASILCLVSAWRACVCCTEKSLTTAAAYASAFSILLSLLFLCLDLPFWAAGQLLLSSIPIITILLCSAIKAQQKESILKSVNFKRKLKAAIAAVIFFCLNGIAIYLSVPLSEMPLNICNNIVIFPQTEYTFQLGSYDSLDNLAALILRICLHYPYLASILLISISTIIIIALKLNSKPNQVFKTEVEKS